MVRRGEERRVDRVDLGDEAIYAPSAPDHCVAGPEYIVGHAKPRVGIGKAVGLAAQRYAAVDRMPVVPRSILSVVVVGKYAIRVEYRAEERRVGKERRSRGSGQH